jgi:hypothetical protein
MSDFLSTDIFSKPLKFDLDTSKHLGDIKEAETISEARGSKYSVGDSTLDNILLTDPQCENKKKPNPRGSILNKTQEIIEDSIDPMEQCRDYHKQIEDQIGSLDTKLNDILTFHELDFLRAYKDQMFVLKKELKHLRDKLDEEELKRLRDEKIVFFRQERDYFRAQALRLENEKNQYIRDINNLKMKLLTVKDDKKYFETFVIEARKENKDLKDEIRRLYEQKDVELIQHAKNDYYSKLSLGRHATPQELPDFQNLSASEFIGDDEKEYNKGTAVLFKDKYMAERRRAEQLQRTICKTTANKKDFIVMIQNCVAEVKRDLYYKKFVTQGEQAVGGATGQTRKLLVNAEDELIDQDKIDSKVNFLGLIGRFISGALGWVIKRPY